MADPADEATKGDEVEGQQQTEQSGDGREEENNNNNVVKETETTTPDEDEEQQRQQQQSRDYSNKVLEYLREARDDGEELGDNAPAFSNYRNIPHDTAGGGGGEDEGEEMSTPTRPLSPGSSSSMQDQTPSIQNSLDSSSVAASRSKQLPFGFSHSLALKPFDRRFSSTLLSPSPSIDSRPGSPGFFPADHSRSSSVSGSVLGGGSKTDNSEETDIQSPWEVVRWTKLKRITNQVFTEQAKRNVGAPTCIAISATIAVGTSKGLILVFDYGQNLKSVVGLGTKSVESGPVTALAVSQDHTTIASGHADGTIYTWELARPAKPFLTIPPLPLHKLEQRKQDGHTEGLAVLHIGFLGTRHTALASSDEKGMAFSHLATRGLGAVGRTVKTTRLLGRYPFDIGMTGKPRKPSSILGFSPLPLGNTTQATDSMGLIAMLTPYLLVIVSTTPIAQTQFKANRPKEVSRNFPLSGCLAWFPAVKLKSVRPDGTPDVSRPRLVYCWSNHLTLMDLVMIEDERDPNRPPSLRFRNRGRWECDESIAAVQWISRQIICVLTISQRLIVLEDRELQVAETFDLMSKQIIRHPTFRKTLYPLVQSGGESSATSYTSIADAYYNSFKTYKGRVFLLCAGELTVGTLSNWADRLLALMEVGDYIAAIKLATSYYIAEDNRVTIGLPDDPRLRHPLVGEKLLELMKASLRFLFGKVSRGEDAPTKEQSQELAEVCFFACLNIDRLDFIFDEAFESFEEGSAVGVFLETMEQHILDGKIKALPPTVVKALVTHYTSSGWEERLEEIICRLETTSLDIDQVTTLCAKHRLYDAMTYVWNQALNDYITPLIQLLQLLTPILNSNTDIDAANATKIFPYLAYTLTGRVYPSGELLPDDRAAAAKASVYYFLFVGRAIKWPLHTGTLFLTTGDATTEPSFPYLRLILRFDGPSLLSALNEAFEDPFLNGPTDQNIPSSRDLPEDQVFGKSVNRQYIVSILLEVISDETLPPMDGLYLNMFIARNLPKFPQYLLLTGSSLHGILRGLCSNEADEIAEDCQLSVEYLLSVYRPPDMDELVELCENARFWRVLKSIFRQERKYARLIETYFRDEEERGGVFECIGACLTEAREGPERSRREVVGVLEGLARELVQLDVVRTAETVQSYVPELHGRFLDAIEDREHEQFVYLQTLLEPTVGAGEVVKRPEAMKKADFVERYIRLMCKFQQEHVSQFVGDVRSGDIKLENVLPTMEESGIVDAAVLLMARDGQVKEAMDRLVAHLGTLGGVLSGLLEARQQDPSLKDDTPIEETLAALKKYTQVGIWLCRGQSRQSAQKSPLPKFTPKLLTPTPLTPPQSLWLHLLLSLTRLTKPLLSLPPSPLTHLTTTSLRTLTQSTFTPLLTDPLLTPHFLPILRSFLHTAQTDSPTLSSLRTVLSSIFSAYTYESSLLSLTQSLLDHALFASFSTLAARRQRGWRPTSQSCEACLARVWGPGVGSGVFEQWERRRRVKEEVVRRRRSVVTVEEERSLSRGKMKARRGEEEEELGPGEGEEGAEGRGVVVFVCGHVYHRGCLERLVGEGVVGAGEEEGGSVRCLGCSGGGV